MTISEQVQNDYAVAWQVIGPHGASVILGGIICFVSYLSFNPPMVGLTGKQSHTGKQGRYGDHILHICQVDKFLGDEDKKGLYMPGTASGKLHLR